MTTNLPQRVPNANLPGWCPPPPGGWFRDIDSPVDDDGDQRDIQWPQRELDPPPALALLHDSELPDDGAERAALLERVRNGIQRIPARHGPEAGWVGPPPVPTGPRHARPEDEQ
jgi:hypothetical protein